MYWGWLLKKVYVGWGRWWRCKGVEVGFVEAVGYCGGRVRPGKGSDLEGAVGTRDCSRVVERPRGESDRHCH